ncbi:hypothetical protein Dda_0594 [Drechslerella dactyloides]|uniref:Rhodopsin domain-containing protein n=1 Tax=Drechslerella dactyloides TaxID=74499 RepID=A0AAD6J4I1_DREDA|nr:hypothetical protein Dda_0594 [Drechslerella dactyloides]
MMVNQYTASFIALFAVAFIATATRTYTRQRINKGLHTEDWLAVIACAILLVQVVLCCLFTPRYTFLVEAPLSIKISLSPQGLLDYIKLTLEYYIGSYIGFLTALWLVKFSFLFFYKRLAEGRSWSKLWIFTFVFCALSYVGNIIGFFLVCIPFSTYFDTTCQRQTVRSNASLYGATATDIISDLLIMAIPLRLIRHLRMSGLQKLGLACLFCLGFVVVVLSLARTIRINAGGSGAYPQSDPRWVALWSIAEETTAILVCCLPAIRKLFSTHRQRRSGLGSGSGESDAAHATTYTRKRWSLSLRGWTLKYGVKTEESMSTSAGRTRTDSVVELESGLSTMLSSPPMSPLKPERPMVNVSTARDSLRSFEERELAIYSTLPGVIPPLPALEARYKHAYAM